MVKPLRELVSNLVTFNLGKSQMDKLFDEVVQLDRDKYQRIWRFLMILSGNKGEVLFLKLLGISVSNCDPTDVNGYQEGVQHRC